MKKSILSSAAALLLVAGLFVSGCKKDDTAAPIVTLSGSSSMTISLNSSFTDPGATASDDEDGTVSVSVSGTVDKDTKGTYVLTYTATDAAGNVGSATRTVTVVNDAEKYAGAYTTTEDASNWTQTITTDEHVNNIIIFSKFANYTNNNQIYATVTGTVVGFTAQSATGIGGSGCTHNFGTNGAGNAITQVSSGKYTFSIKFTDEQVLGGASCLAVATTPYEDTFLQQ